MEEVTGSEAAAPRGSQEVGVTGGFSSTGCARHPHPPPRRAVTIRHRTERHAWRDRGATGQPASLWGAEAAHRGGGPAAKRDGGPGLTLK